MPNSFCLLVKPRFISCHCVLPLYFDVMSILFANGNRTVERIFTIGVAVFSEISSHDLEQDELYSIWVLKDL